MKKIYLLCISLLILVSCKSTQDMTSQMSISYVKPPKWVTQEEREFLSAVGLANGELHLMKATPLAEQNAIENLKFNIIFNIESFLLEETLELDVNKRKKIIDDIKEMARTTITEEFLQLASRRDEMWKSPNTNALYVKVVADGRQISMKIISIIEELQRTYAYDSEILACLLSTEHDILHSKILNIVEDYKMDVNNKYDSRYKDRLEKTKNSTNYDDIQQSNDVIKKEETADYQDKISAVPSQEVKNEQIKNNNEIKNEKVAKEENINNSIKEESVNNNNNNINNINNNNNNNKEITTQSQEVKNEQIKNNNEIKNEKVAKEENINNSIKEENINTNNNNNNNNNINNNINNNNNNEIISQSQEVKNEQIKNNNEIKNEKVENGENFDNKKTTNKKKINKSKKILKKKNKKAKTKRKNSDLLKALNRALTIAKEQEKIMEM